jgi:hypothetical protein
MKKKFYKDKDDTQPSGYGAPPLDFSFLKDLVAATPDNLKLVEGTIEWDNIPTWLVTTYAVEGYLRLLDGRTIVPPEGWEPTQQVEYLIGDMTLVVEVLAVSDVISNLRMDLS